MSSLLELGHATSRNLKFSYRSDVPVSYGEETITESNLLELTRRHSDVLRLRTFSKHQESKVGSDWEWFVVGRRRTLGMRVQAKRVQSNDVLKIRHAVGGSGIQQRELLIQSSMADGMRPMYCIYCTESQRRLWNKLGNTETGCLLADARNVQLQTKALGQIEWACWPWHYLLEVAVPHIKIDHLVPGGEYDEKGLSFPPPQRPRPVWNLPNFLDLNEDTPRRYDRTGVEETTKFDLARVADGGAEDAGRWVESERDRRSYESPRRMVAIDVRSCEVRSHETRSR